ncbi:MAG: ABC transporter ATP-binding protein [Burkholderiales bacterium]
MAALLDIRIEQKNFGTLPVLRNVGLTVHAGETVSLVGASGCGKSTLLRLASGLDRDYQGTITLNGAPLAGITREIGFIFQEPRLFPWLTVAENVAFDIGRQGAHDPRVVGLLAEVGLTGFANALPKQLSGGMAQRASIARGLFTQPRLLLLDEPFSAVDAFTRMKLQDLLLAVARQHEITLLLVTHDIDEALYLSDRVVIISERPGSVTAEIAVPQSRPRDRRNTALSALRSKVLNELYAAHAI